MRRREFMLLLGGACGAVAWPRAARAQSSERMRRIGVLMAYAESDSEAQAWIAGFREGLRRLGWTEGGNISLDVRWATGEREAIERFAKELVARGPELVLASTTTATAALLQQTRTIPIVFALVSDPVGSGFVASFARPSGNATGFTTMDPTMAGKWLELLKEIAPRVVRGPGVDVGKVGRELGVRYVLEGSVRRAGNRVRITAQLIEAATGHHLWADRYDRELADVFAVQDEIARSITGAISPHFEAVFGWGDGPAESHDRLGEAARKAVAADDSDAVAHTALAIFELFSGRHEEARRRLHRALSLNPNSEVARGYLGASYAFGGDDEVALPHLEEAIRLSPRGLLLVIWHLCKGWAALLTERYEEAVEFTEHAREANPEFPDIYAVLASAYGHLGNPLRARAALDQLLHRMPGLTASDERLVRPFARVADRERFLKGLRKAGLPET